MPKKSSPTQSSQTVTSTSAADPAKLLSLAETAKPSGSHRGRKSRLDPYAEVIAKLQSNNLSGNDIVNWLAEHNVKIGLPGYYAWSRRQKSVVVS